MDSSRKGKLTNLPQNLIYLREQKGGTQEEMAKLLALSGKSSYRAYESGGALPDIHKLMKLASFFEVPVYDLVYKDLENSRNKSTAQPKKMFEVPKVPVSAAAGYPKGFGDNSYIKKLKTIKIPYEPYGIARAFDIAGDSMEPVIADGSTVIGIKISPLEIMDNKEYIVVTDDDLLCKNIRLQKGSDYVYLISKNEKYPPRHILKEQVKELWEVWKTL